MRVITIVEGHGETEAVPLLVRRMAARLDYRGSLELPHPIRVNRGRLLRAGELERAVDLAGRKSSAGDAILVVFDADGDCPATLAPAVLARAVASRRDRRIAVIIANREYEAWLIAASDSLVAQGRLRPSASAPANPEDIRNPKAWLSDHLAGSRSYSETIDQAALTAVFDLTEARRAASFDKFFREVESLLV